MSPRGHATHSIEVVDGSVVINETASVIAAEVIGSNDVIDAVLLP